MDKNTRCNLIPCPECGGLVVKGLCEKCQIKRLEAELARHKKAISIAFNFISAEGDCAEQACHKEIEHALKEKRSE